LGQEGQAGVQTRSLPPPISTIDGVPTSAHYRWRPSAPATLVWVEALDVRSKKESSLSRHHVLMLKAPFTESPGAIIKTEQRFGPSQWEKKATSPVSDYDRDRAGPRP